MNKKILILGAGLVVPPMVKYLLGKGYSLTIASNTPDRAQHMVAGHPDGKVIFWEADDKITLAGLIGSHDLVVSLLPYTFHVMVAEICLEMGKNMVTTSYVKPEMRALDQKARQKGIIILNEIGLDPGIDHMSAMRIIDHVHNQGGKILEFYSLCGALPAPECADNPFRYKFSWSPKGVVMASNNDAKYLHHGKITDIPTSDLFKKPMVTNFSGVGELEIYPNRDSLQYIDIYGIREVNTMYRGTFRYPGWCESLDAIKACQLVSGQKQDFSGLSYAGFMASMIGSNDPSDIKRKTASFLHLDVNSHALHAMEWLGLFSDEPMNRKDDTPFEITSDLMISRMMIAPGERDMVAMMHLFLAAYPDGKQELIRSTMLDFGDPDGDTSVARTVALPAAIGVEMILKGEIAVTGVHIPVIKGIYQPVLENLERLGIRMVEEFNVPLSEKIG